MILPITSTLAAILALIMLPLTIQISVRRARLGLKSGNIAAAVFDDLGDLRLRGSVRAFGNFIEYVPLCLILFGLMEMQGAPADLLLWLGGVFVAGRIIHALAMTFKPDFPAPRGLAMFATYAALLVPAFWLLQHNMG